MEFCPKQNPLFLPIFTHFFVFLIAISLEDFYDGCGLQDFYDMFARGLYNWFAGGLQSLQKKKIKLQKIHFRLNNVDFPHILGFSPVNSRAKW